MSTPTTRRYPRSLAEAFGEHTSTDFAEDRPRARFEDKVMYVIGVIVLLVIWWTR